MPTLTGEDTMPETTAANPAADAPEPSGLNILVTGASGMMGLPIAIALAKRNTVFGVARFSSAAEEKTLRQASVETIRLDFSNPDMSRLPRRIDVVYHLGAMIGAPAERPENRQAAYEANAYSAARLMTRYRDCMAFIHGSSGSTYAYQGERPLREDDPFGLHTGLETYTTSKIGAEFIVQALAREWTVPTAILRIFSPYSVRGGAITMRVDQMAAGRAVTLYPGAPNRYCPIYEDDYVRKAIRAIGIVKTPPEVVNFCGTVTTTIEEYCAIAGRYLGKAPRFENTSKLYPIWPDTTKSLELLGPDRVSLEDGIRRVVEAGPGARLSSWATVMPD
ncbi:MAG: NAD(P)-dependent oxidoreductase [Rhodospirillaceae bacterium]|nr:MAG: NAD(P)-dependent oxidoreductase [Rhodospirillaceae bacterium]